MKKSKKCGMAYASEPGEKHTLLAYPNQIRLWPTESSGSQPVPTNLPVTCRNDSEASGSRKDPYREFDERPPAQAMLTIVLHCTPPEASRRRHSGAQFHILPESEKKHNHP
jgi:hypothetical protein